jgi:hypothetical protein
VARTEVVSAANAGAVHRMSMLGKDALLFKQWVATLDARTRPSHAAADGQVQERNGRFRVGAAYLEYPGDPLGPPGEVINCRCTIIFTDRLAGETDVEGRQEGGVEPVVETVAEPETITAIPEPEAYPGGLTQKQAESWLHDRHGLDADGNRRALYVDGLGPRAANEVAETLHDLFTRYPHVARRIRVAGTSSKVTNAINQVPGVRIRNVSPRAYADAVRTFVPGDVSGSIRINASKARRYDEMVDSLKRDSMAGFHPPGTDSIAGITRHEFGHHLYWEAQDAAADRGVLADMRRELEEAIRRAIRRVAPSAGEGSAEWNRARYDVIRFDVSKYALTNTDELMAEAFAFVTSHDKPTILASELIEILTRYARPGGA